MRRVGASRLGPRRAPRPSGRTTRPRRRRARRAPGGPRASTRSRPTRRRAPTSRASPDSRLMRKSKQHEYRQAYNAQAVADAGGSQLEREKFHPLQDHEIVRPDQSIRLSIAVPVAWHRHCLCMVEIGEAVGEKRGIHSKNGSESVVLASRHLPGLLGNPCRRAYFCRLLERSPYRRSGSAEPGAVHSRS